MFKDISLTLFNNQELISLLVLESGVLVFSYMLYQYLKKKGKFQASADQQTVHKNRWTLMDTLISATITIMFLVIALWQLGATAMPQTRWQPTEANESFILEIEDGSSAFDRLYLLSGEGDNNALDSGYQLGLKNIVIEGSNDLSQWEPITHIEDSSYLQWEVIDGQWNYRYLRITAGELRNVINEIGIKRAGFDEFLPLRVYSKDPTGKFDPQLVIDEQAKLTIDPLYLNETYFDEIYHVRNAQEIAEGQVMYAFVHPLLGTQIITSFIRLLGNNPFAWRVGGVLFSAAMIPLLYDLSRRLFKKTFYAALGAIFLTCDFMHLTTARIATLEPFSVFFIILMTYFMVRYMQLNFYKDAFKKTLGLLALSGISMGIGVSVKWTGAYAGLGLAVLFFASLFARYSEYRRAKKQTDPSFEEKHIVEVFPKYCLITLLWCCLWFVLIPLTIYALSYFPCIINRNVGWSLSGVIKQTVGMYNYHANLEATHPFQSVWWQWIVDARPIWYYHHVSDSVVYTISAFGNPFIWWSGLLAVLFGIFDFIKNKAKTAGIIVVCYFAQLIPWMLVTRCVFIYHYYPAVPFLILALVYALKRLIEIDPRYQKRVIVFTILCVILFVLFLPATAGFGTTKSYIDGFMRWFPSWYFG